MFIYLIPFLMAEHLTGSAPETVRTKPSKLRGALAAIGLLAASEAAAENQGVDQPSAVPVAEQVARDISARLRDCAAEATQAQKDWLAAQLEEADVDADDARAWLRGKRGDEAFVAELKDVKLVTYNDCRSENDEIVLAALDERIAQATAEFAKHGFRVGETEDGETMLFFAGANGEDVPAAHFQPGKTSGDWELDFAPLEAYREELAKSSTQLREQSAQRQENIEAMESRIRYIWQQIKNGETIEPKEAALRHPAPDIETASVETKS